MQGLTIASKLNEQAIALMTKDMKQRPTNLILKV